MLRIAHLVAGFTALLLSAVPSFSSAFLNTPDAVYLAFIGLLNLLATLLGSEGKRPTLDKAASALLILAAVIQSLILLAPLPLLAGQPAAWLSLLISAAAIAVLLGSRTWPQTNSKTQGTIAQLTPTGQDKRETGTVKWFNTSKGFGFISRDTGEDIFVHFRAIRGEGHRILIEGQRVEFSVMQRDKGLQAEDVTPLAPARH